MWATLSFCPFVKLREEEVMAWIFEYQLHGEEYQKKEFESRGEGLVYAEREFPAFIRAPNKNWEELRSTGHVQLDGGGFLQLLPK